MCLQVVAQAKKETNRKEGTLLEQLQAAISSDKQFLRLPELDVLLETLEEKKHDLQQKEKENNLELLLHFLTHSKCVLACAKPCLQTSLSQFYIFILAQDHRLRCF